MGLNRNKVRDVHHTGGKLSKLSANDKESMRVLARNIEKSLDSQNIKNTKLTNAIKGAIKLAVKDGLVLENNNSLHEQFAKKLAENIKISSNFKPKQLYHDMHKMGLFKEKSNAATTEPEVRTNLRMTK